MIRDRRPASAIHLTSCHRSVDWRRPVLSVQSEQRPLYGKVPFAWPKPTSQGTLGVPFHPVWHRQYARLAGVIVPNLALTQIGCSIGAHHSSSLRHRDPVQVSLHGFASEGVNVTRRTRCYVFSRNHTHSRQFRNLRVRWKALWQSSRAAGDRATMAAHRSSLYFYPERRGICRRRTTLRLTAGWEHGEALRHRYRR